MGGGLIGDIGGELIYREPLGRPPLTLIPHGERIPPIAFSPLGKVLEGFPPTHHHVPPIYGTIPIYTDDQGFYIINTLHVGAHKGRLHV